MKIEGNVWVAGIVVAVMSVVNKVRRPCRRPPLPALTARQFFDARYEVSYQLRGGVVTRPFGAERMRPAAGAADERGTRRARILLRPPPKGVLWEDGRTEARVRWEGGRRQGGRR